MTLREEIASAAEDIAYKPKEKRRKFFNIGFLGERIHLILEFIKWLLFFFGVLGILANNQFMSWLNSINMSLGDLFSTKIIGLPLATLCFMTTILLACIFATLQKRAEIVSRERIDEVASVVSKLAKDLGKGTRTLYVGRPVLNQLGEVRNTLSKLSMDLENLKSR